MVPQSTLISKQPYFDGKQISCNDLSIENTFLQDCVHSFFLTHIMPFIKTADNLYSDENTEFHVPLIFQSQQFFKSDYGEFESSYNWIKKM